MGREFCDFCGQEMTIIIPITSGERICHVCNDKLQDSQDILNLNIPENVKWVGRVARQGKARMFIVPKTQRPFFELNRDYLIIVKKI